LSEGERTRTVRVPSDIYEAIVRLKETLGLRSAADAAKLLMQFGEAPVVVLALALDLREDMKELIREIRRLNELLEKTLKTYEEWRRLWSSSH